MKAPTPEDIESQITSLSQLYSQTANPVYRERMEQLFMSEHVSEHVRLSYFYGIYQQLYDAIDNYPNNSIERSALVLQLNTYAQKIRALGLPEPEIKLQNVIEFSRAKTMQSFFTAWFNAYRINNTTSEIEELVKSLPGDFLEKFPDAQELDLSGIWGPGASNSPAVDAQLRVIILALPSLTKINRINLSGNHFSKEQLQLLAILLRNQHQILGLNLSNCNIRRD